MAGRGKMRIQVNGYVGDDVQGGDNPWRVGERDCTGTGTHMYIYTESTHIGKNTQANAFAKKTGTPSLHLLHQII